METNNTVELKQVKPIVANQDSDYGSKDSGIGDNQNSIDRGHDNPVFDVEEGPRQRQTNVPENENTDDRDDSDSEDDDDDDDVYGNPWSRSVKRVQTILYSSYTDNHTATWTTIYIVLACLYMAYFIYSLIYRFGDEGSWRLLICTILAVLLINYNIAYSFLGEQMTLTYYWNRIERDTRERFAFWVHLITCLLLIVGAIIFIIIEVALETPRNLISLGGMAAFIVIFYFTSHNPSRVNWRPVYWGLILQFYFALLILRWDPGYKAFRWLGDRVEEFLAYTDEGSRFVFGDDFEHHFFAFKVLTVIVFFSTVISVLYYLGVMQFIIRNVAVFMATLMTTSPAESLNAAGNIFIGQTEAPLMIRPFLSKMTRSELHAICTGGFATIAGSVMAAYILYKVPANHLLSASVMSAPAALAMSKLFYPETRKSRAGSEVYNMKSGQERNIIEAASKGATQSVKLVANIAVNLIAFISLLEFVNQTLIWFGNRAGMEKPGDELTFQFICSYVFSPISFVMGVDFGDCRKVAELIGYKTFINEFYAYTKLSEYINNRENLTWYENLPYTAFNSTVNATVFTGNWTYSGEDIVYLDFNHTLTKGILTDRSVVISTYALCGFSNISSIGIMLGALGAMAPNKTKSLSQVVVRAMIAGNVACFMTACIAGLLYEPGR